AMGFLEECEAVLGSRDLYALLGVPRGASEGDVRRGYRRKALDTHPDRAGPGATRAFQLLGKAYTLLKDKDTRAAYDEHGTVDEESDVLSQDCDWEQYFRMLFKKITVEDVRKFEKTYKESEEELADLKQAYVSCEGDMDGILETVLCAAIEDEPRFRATLQAAVDAQELPDFPAFSQESKQKRQKRRRKYTAEAKEAEAHAKELGLDGSDDTLQALILKRQENNKNKMDSFLADLESKYCKKGKNAGPATKKGKGKK
uniref:DnaJ (Hsp40) homolog, subfamily C, member 9 n=2 Tax=Petromyzon marinus TaxID=7757 RepID=S4RPP7_PETMA